MRLSPDQLRSLHQRLEPLGREFSESDATTVALQVALAEIPSPTGGEHQRARAVVREFAARGVESKVDEVGNVIARVRGKTAAPPVAVCAHLDTVFPDSVEHRVLSRGGRLVGPGIGDNARGLAAAIQIAGALTRIGGFEHPVLFAATVGEEGEGDLRGARHLFATSAADASAAVILDGAGDERVVTHALGTRRFRITFASEGGHSWAASDAPNPVHAAARLAAAIADLPRPQTPRSTLAVTRIHGGSAVNAIAGDATLDVDTRSSSRRVLDEWERSIRRLATQVLQMENEKRGRRWRRMEVSIAVVSDRPAGSAPADSGLVEVALLATECIGRRPECAIASTDANIPLSLGIPAVSLGAGGIGGDTHTPFEWFENREGALGLSRALTVIGGAGEQRG